MAVSAVEGGEAMRRVSWGAIFVGTVIAMALMVFFTTLGLAIGAAVVDPLYEDDPLAGLTAGSGVYLVVTQMISLATGGYAAARLAGVPRTVASMLNGAAVWAVATLFLAWAAIFGGGAIFGATSSLVSSAARGADNLIETVTPDDFSFPDFSEMAAQVSVQDLPPELREALNENDVTLTQLRREARNAFRNVVSAQEQQRALNILRGALADALRTPGDIGTDVEQAIDDLVSGPNAVFSAEDREEVLSVLETRLGITPEETEQLVQTIETRIEGAVAELRQTLDQIQQQALEIAQTASATIASTAFWLAVASVLGLAAAVAGAFAGKPDGFLGERVYRRI